VQRFLAAVGLLALVGTGVLAAAAALMVRSGLSTRSRPSALEEALARTMRGLASTRTRSLKPASAAPPDLKAARAHWASHCALCHGVGGAGDTDIGRNLYPPAPDMRAQTTQRQSDGELYAAINNGIRLTGMPAWGTPGDDDEETWGLVALIRTLPALDEDARAEIEQNLPKTPHQQAEDMEEDDFLRGGSQPPHHPEMHP
jgi:mono/diheme cytochrome c family protein